MDRFNNVYTVGEFQADAVFSDANQINHVVLTTASASSVALYVRR